MKEESWYALEGAVLGETHYSAVGESECVFFKRGIIVIVEGARSDDSRIPESAK